MEEQVDIVDNNGELIVETIQFEEVSVPKYILDVYPRHSLVEKLREIKSIEYNDGDVLLCTFPKTGTHWVFNLLKLLLYEGPIEKSPSYKPMCVEGLSKEEYLSSPSPRVIHMHSKIDRAPTAFLEKGKIILLVRNPKDTAVSMHQYVQWVPTYNIAQKWNYFIANFFKEKFLCGIYTDYLNSVQRAIYNSKKLDIHLVYYEDLKKNGLYELRRMQEFLGYNHDVDRLQAILDRCTVPKLGNDIDEGRTDSFTKDNNEKQVVYRKGQIGDWKNHFTVAQNEAFEAEWEAQMKDSMFHFKYT